MDTVPDDGLEIELEDDEDWESEEDDAWDDWVDDKNTTSTQEEKKDD